MTFPKKPVISKEPVEVDGILMREVLRKSPVPFYAAGLLWVIYALAFPLYRLWDFLIAAALSVGAFFLAELLFPGKKELVPEEEQPVFTGNQAADQLVAEGRESIRQLKQTNAEIPDPEISRKIDRMAEVAGKIFDFVAEQPSKAGQIRKFMNYYLPTTLNLLRSYAKLDRQEVEGENITGTMSEISHILDTVVPAFEKQLDALFQDEALDASVEIEVLKSMLVQEGLAEDGLHKDS